MPRTNIAIKKDKIAEGKTKIVYATQFSDIVILYHKNDMTAFNGEKHEIFTDKGLINMQISTILMKILQKNKIKTHYIDLINNEYQICHNAKPIPLEVVIRNIAAGSFVKNYGIEQGINLAYPIVEFFYKKDGLQDPLLTESHIEYFQIATKSEIRRITNISLKINEILKQIFLQIGLKLVDFKIEFGRSIKNKGLILIDEISPDSCRLWDSSGNSVDKDVFRRGSNNVMDSYKLILNKLQNSIL